ncbi:MAG: LD-carboxypeptidase [Pseudomonadota bacterium]
MNTTVSPLETPPIRPGKLARGEKIALVATGSPFDRDAFDVGVRLLASLGFEVKYSPLVFQQEGYLAGSDEIRAQVIREALTDDEVRVLFCIRGGYGTLRTLPHIEPGLFRDFPKTIIGFSDVTALLNHAFSAGNLITFHGPMLAGLKGLAEESFSHFLRLITKGEPFRIAPRNREIINKGSAQGRLIGGNMTTLVHTLGTPYEPTWDGRILFLEDAGERLYRIDRLFSHLKYAGRLARVAGIVLGQFTDGAEEAEVWEFAHKNLGDLEIPIVGGFPFGHGKDNMAVPVGGLFSLDHEGVLQMLEPCLA